MIVSGFEELGRDLRSPSQKDSGAIAAIAAFVGGALWIIDPIVGVLGAVATGGGLYWYLPATTEEHDDLGFPTVSIREL